MSTGGIKHRLMNRGQMKGQILTAKKDVTMACGLQVKMSPHTARSRPKVSIVM